MEEIVRDAITLLVIINPVAAIPVFVAVTSAASTSERRRVARKCVVVSAVVLVGAVAVGQLVLEAMGIRLVSFQAAGGIILFLFGVQMVFAAGSSAPSAADDPGRDVAVFPLAIPVIAGPGAIMTAVLVTDNHRFSLREQALTTAILLGILAVTYLCLLGGAAIQRVLGETGTSVVSRVMGLVVCAMAVETVLTANLLILGLPWPSPVRSSRPDFCWLSNLTRAASPRGHPDLR